MTYQTREVSIPYFRGRVDLSRPSGAAFTEDGIYRLVLWRRWDARNPPLMAICLNPSTADEAKDDATVRRLRAFSKREGAGGLVLLNLFPLRATKPADLWRSYRLGEESPDVDNPLPETVRALAPLCLNPVLLAWGAIPQSSRDAQLLGIIYDTLGALRDVNREAVCLGVTKSGDPRHPLYLRSDEPFVSYRA